MTASVLAVVHGVSVRTIYRDVPSLIAEGAPATGEAGLGHPVGPGHFLPPLMLDEDEAEAVMLGLRLVQRRGNAALGTSAARAMAKIGAVLPQAIDEAIAANGRLVGPHSLAAAPHLEQIRQAMRDERTLLIWYMDQAGGTKRTVGLAGGDRLLRGCRSTGHLVRVASGFSSFRDGPTGRGHAKRRQAAATPPHSACRVAKRAGV